MTPEILSSGASTLALLTFLFGPAGWLLYQVVRSTPLRLGKPEESRNP